MNDVRPPPPPQAPINRHQSVCKGPSQPGQQSSCLWIENNKEAAGRQILFDPQIFHRSPFPYLFVWQIDRPTNHPLPRHPSTTASSCVRSSSSTEAIIYRSKRTPEHATKLYIESFVWGHEKYPWNENFHLNSSSFREIQRREPHNPAAAHLLKLLIYSTPYVFVETKGIRNGSLIGFLLKLSICS